MLHANSVRETDKSVLVKPQDFEYDGALWIPKSAIEPDGVVSDFFCRKYKDLTGTLQITREAQAKEEEKTDPIEKQEQEADVEDVDELCNVLQTDISKPATQKGAHSTEDARHTEPQDAHTKKLEARISKDAIVLSTCLSEGAELEAVHYGDIEMTDAERVEIQRKLGTTLFINQ